MSQSTSSRPSYSTVLKSGGVSPRPSNKVHFIAEIFASEPFNPAYEVNIFAGLKLRERLTYYECWVLIYPLMTTIGFRPYILDQNTNKMIASASVTDIPEDPLDDMFFMPVQSGWSAEMQPIYTISNMMACSPYSSNSRIHEGHFVLLYHDRINNCIGPLTLTLSSENCIERTASTRVTDTLTRKAATKDRALDRDLMCAVTHYKLPYTRVQQRDIQYDRHGLPPKHDFLMADLDKNYSAVYQGVHIFPLAKEAQWISGHFQGHIYDNGLLFTIRHINSRTTIPVLIDGGLNSLQNMVIMDKYYHHFYDNFEFTFLAQMDAQGARVRIIDLSDTDKPEMKEYMYRAKNYKNIHDRSINPPFALLNWHMEQASLKFIRNPRYGGKQFP